LLPAEDLYPPLNLLKQHELPALLHPLLELLKEQHHQQILATSVANKHKNSRYYYQQKLEAKQV
jgi:hypothetical protein